MHTEHTILASRFCLFLVVGLGCGLVKGTASPPVPCPIPLEKGTSWTYEGKVKWTIADSAMVRSTNVHWVMEVIETKENESGRVAVVRGFPDELAWYEPHQSPRFSVILSVSNRICRVAAKSEREAEELAKRFVGELPRLPPCAEEWLVLPLAERKRWGGDTNRDDNWYCWYVQNQKVKKVRVRGFSAKRPVSVWTLAYRTNPDHQIMDIAAGIGITRYVFEHHGTVASADVRLISFKRSAIP